MKDLEERTKRFSLSILRLTASLPRTREADVVARQLLRSATSIGANYREAHGEASELLAIFTTIRKRPKL